MEIRRLRSDEGDVLRTLRLSALKDSPSAFGGSYEAEAALPLSEFSFIAEARAISERDAIFVASDGLDFVGLIGAYFDNDSGEPFISSLWVAPAHRRNGIGALLVHAARRWLVSLGAESIQAWVTSTNSNAIAFYESLGFESVGRAKPLPSNTSLMERLYVCRSTSRAVRR